MTRQPNLTDAHALEEVTALQLDRTHLVELVMDRPLLLQDLGRSVDERRARVDQALEHALEEVPEKVKDSAADVS